MSDINLGDWFEYTVQSSTIFVYVNWEQFRNFQTTMLWLWSDAKATHTVLVQLQGTLPHSSHCFDRKPWILTEKCPREPKRRLHATKTKQILDQSQQTLCELKRWESSAALSKSGKVRLGIQNTGKESDWKFGTKFDCLLKPSKLKRGRPNSDGLEGRRKQQAEMSGIAGVNRYLDPVLTYTQPVEIGLLGNFRKPFSRKLTHSSRAQETK